MPNPKHSLPLSIYFRIANNKIQNFFRYFSATGEFCSGGQIKHKIGPRKLFRCGCLTFAFAVSLKLKRNIWPFVVSWLQLLRPIDSHSSVCASAVRPCLEIRASDFDDFCIDVRDRCPEGFGLSAVC